jgi:small subunit ribosomal protein S20
MANHKSALKRIRQNAEKKIHNRYYGRTMRNAIRDFRSLEDKGKAEETISKVISLIDKNAKRHIIHKNKAGNLKSKLMRQVNSMK